MQFHFNNIYENYFIIFLKYKEFMNKTYNKIYDFI